jgi:hypothetical protein
MRAILLTSVLGAVLMSPMAAPAATYTPVTKNQGFIAYDNGNSEVDLGAFNLAEGAVAISALFADLDVSGWLNFNVFSDPIARGAAGSMDINLTRQGGFPGTDNEIFRAFFGGTALTFQNVQGDLVATFSAPFSSISDIVRFELDFSGFDPGDLFQLNIARVAAVPLPATLPLFFLALGGLGFLAGRRRLPA